MHISTIRIENLYLAFKKQVIFSQASLALQVGKSYCLIGKNGTGKSSLLYLLLGFLKPQQGHIYYDTQPLVRLSAAAKQQIGYMGDVSGLIEELNAMQYLRLMGAIYHLPPKQAEARSQELLQYFFEDTEDLKHKHIKTYSSGMKKKLEIIAAVLHQPNILFLDEPFAALDLPFSERLITFLEEYSSPERIILFSSHNAEYIRRIEAEVLLISEQKIQTVERSTLLEDSDSGSHQQLLKLLQ